MKHLGFGVLSLIAMLAWWTLTGDDRVESSLGTAPLPSIVAGGGHAIEVTLETSEPI